MAIIVNEQDTINQWRTKFNTFSEYVGALENLQVPAEDDSSQYVNVVSAINAINSKLNPTLIDLLSDNAQNSSVNKFYYDSSSGIVTFISRDILDSDIGAFDAALFTSGKVDERRIQGLDASVLTSGTLDAARLPASATVQPFSIASTDELPAGATNKYYDQTKVRAAITHAANNYFSFNNSTGELVWEFGVPDSAPSAGTGVTIVGSEVSIGQDVSVSSPVTFSSIVVSGQISAETVGGNMVSNFTQAVEGTASNVMMTPKSTVQNQTRNFNNNLKHVELILPITDNTVRALNYDFSGQGSSYFGGDVPDFVELELVCKTPEHGWGTGDVIQINAGAAPAGGNSGISFQKDKASAPDEFSIIFGENGPGEYGEGTSGRGVVLTSSNWNVKIRMIKFVSSSVNTNENSETYVF